MRRRAGSVTSCQKTSSSAPGYSQVVVGEGRLVMVSGQVALDAAGALIGAGSASAQAGQALTNRARCLAAAGCDWPNAAKLTCYVTDPAATRPFMLPLHERLNGASPPASMVVVVDALVLLQVEALAFTTVNFESTDQRRSTRGSASRPLVCATSTASARLRTPSLR